MDVSPPDNRSTLPLNKRCIFLSIDGINFTAGFSKDIRFKAGLDFYPGPFSIYRRIAIIHRRVELPAKNGPASINRLIYKRIGIPP